MLTAGEVRDCLLKIIERRDLFLVDVEVNKNNRIRVLIDSIEGISIDQCADVSRQLEAMLDRDKEDFELEVSSPGLDAPLKVREQYLKNIGQDVNILLHDGNWVAGKLIGIGKEKMDIEVMIKLKDKKQIKGIAHEKMLIPIEQIKSTRIVVKF